MFISLNLYDIKAGIGNINKPTRAKLDFESIRSKKSHQKFPLPQVSP